MAVKKLRESTDIVVTLGGDGAAMAQRLRQISDSVSRAGIKGGWILAVGAAGKDSLRKLPLALRLKARIIDLEPSLGDWPGFRAAALISGADRLLLLPSSANPDSASLRALNKTSANFEWVFGRRGLHPSWLDEAIQMLLAVPPIDLGAPSLVRRPLLAAASGRFDSHESLLGLRSFRAAMSAGAQVGEMPADSETPLRAAECLGLEASSFDKALFRGEMAALAAVTLLTMSVKMQSSGPFFGLLFFVTAVFTLACFIGKPE